MATNDDEPTTGPGADAGDLVVTVDDRVATLWLNRPAKRNAVTFDMWLGIAEHCRRLASDPAVHVLVVRGAGDHFCAGADIGGLAGVPASEYTAANRAGDDGIASFPKPTIAFIAGSCVGGGAEIALACDLRIADTTARFGITPARLGIFYPPFAVERAVRVIGPSATKHLLYSADLVDADRALRVGLIDELHAPDDAVARLATLTGTIADRRSLMTQMASKQIVDTIVAGGDLGPLVSRWDDVRMNSPDPGEGIAAFLERRDPDFRWTHDGPGDPPPT